MGCVVMGSLALLFAFILFVITVKYAKGSNDIAPLFAFVGVVLAIFVAAWSFDNASDFGGGTSCYLLSNVLGRILLPVLLAILIILCAIWAWTAFDTTTDVTIGPLTGWTPKPSTGSRLQWDFVVILAAIALLAAVWLGSNLWDSYKTVTGKLPSLETSKVKVVCELADEIDAKRTSDAKKLGATRHPFSITFEGKNLLEPEEKLWKEKIQAVLNARMFPYTVTKVTRIHHESFALRGKSYAGAFVTFVCKDAANCEYQNTQRFARKLDGNGLNEWAESFIPKLLLVKAKTTRRAGEEPEITPEILPDEVGVATSGGETDDLTGFEPL